MGSVWWLRKGFLGKQLFQFLGFFFFFFVNQGIFFIFQILATSLRFDFENFS